MYRRFLVPVAFDADSFEAMRSACLDRTVVWPGRFGHSFVFAGRQTPTPHSEEWLFRDEASGTSLHLVRDTALQPTGAAVCYAALTGPPAVIEPLRADFVSEAGFMDEASIIDLATTSLDTVPTALLLMALAAADGSDKVPAGVDPVMQTALGHSEPLVRYVAVFAILQAGWAAYLPQLRGMAETDEDANVRILAAEVAAKLGD